MKIYYYYSTSSTPLLPRGAPANPDKICQPRQPEVYQYTGQKLPRQVPFEAAITTQEMSGFKKSKSFCSSIRLLYKPCQPIIKRA